MKKSSVIPHFFIDYRSVIPVYMQLANSITSAISNGKIQKDELMPSINDLSALFKISRDTAEKSYKYLKKTGMLKSVPGLGYFVSGTDALQSLKILLLFNTLSANKKTIYEAFVASLDERFSVDFFVYNNNFEFFKELIQKRKNGYAHYVILPHFMDKGEYADEVISEIPPEKLILLDKLLHGVTGNFGAVYENFEKNIFDALKEALPRLSKYQVLKIIIPQYTYYPKEIERGFYRFCNIYGFKYKIVYDLQTEELNEGTTYITIVEDDLVVLVEKLLATNLIPGKDIGIISYNESPIKKIILNGITTISTDFQLMGERAAALILNKSAEQVEVPFYLRLRPSL